MKATFDFIPGYCPSCGMELTPSQQDEMQEQKEAFCGECGCNMFLGEIRRKPKLDNGFRECANCGDLFHGDMLTPSIVFTGSVCNDCLDQEVPEDETEETDWYTVINSEAGQLTRLFCLTGITEAAHRVYINLAYRAKQPGQVLINKTEQKVLPRSMINNQDQTISQRESGI
jgi:hypothetical protein